MSKLKIACGLRPDENQTNKRVRCLADGFRALGHDVVNVDRGKGVGTSYDMYMQAGFHGSNALVDVCLKGRIPYLICEAPSMRPNNRKAWESDWISWGYNGLMGGAYHHPAPSNVTRTQFPRLQEMRPIDLSGEIYIIGQKPTDHSLRGIDHVKWIHEKMKQYPTAQLRHHPLMYNGVQEPIECVLDRAGLVIVYTSTVGNEALLRGCPVLVENEGCSAYGIDEESRKAWYHEQTWQNFSMLEAQLPAFAAHVMKGYDEALARAAAGMIEIPRAKVNPSNFSKIYHKAFGDGR